MAPLDGAVPLAEVDAVAVGVEQHLDLDVSRALDQPLQDESVVPERRQRLAPRRGQGLG